MKHKVNQLSFALLATVLIFNLSIGAAFACNGGDNNGSGNTDDNPYYYNNGQGPGEGGHGPNNNGQTPNSAGPGPNNNGQTQNPGVQGPNRHEQSSGANGPAPGPAPNEHGQANQDNGAPPHAPAVGHRAKEFRFYPSVNVYFDPAAAVYFCMVDGVWRMLNTLPKNIQVRLGDPVILELDADQPYHQNADHLLKYRP